MIFRKKRISLILVAFLLLSLLCSCGKQENSEKSLKEHGMDVVRLMDEMIRSDDYTALLTSGGVLANMRTQIAEGDYTTPDKVYEVSLPSVEEIFSYLGETDAIGGLSDSLKKYLNSRSASSYISQLNAQEGSEVLAATALYTAGKTFVQSDLKADTLYLYTFRDGYPVAVTFLVGESGAVSASGTFVLNESFNSMSPEQLSELFEGFGIPCTVTPLAE